jgi:hypothetical protein
MKVKREVLFIIGLLLLIAGLVAAMNYLSIHVESADAGKFVLEDLKAKYPTAGIELLKVKDMYNPNGEKYFEVKAKVTESYESACPERSHIYYNYPVQNFVPAPLERVTTESCVVCTTGTCVINYPEEAIIASHTFKGTAELNSFLQSHLSAVPAATESGSDWLVVWKADNLSYSYEVKMDKNGNILSVGRKTASK